MLEKSNNSSETTNEVDYCYLNDEELRMKVDIQNLCLLTPTRPSIDLSKLFESTIKVMDTFFLCDGCAHIYWVAKKNLYIKYKFKFILGRSPLAKHQIKIQICN